MVTPASHVSFQWPLRNSLIIQFILSGFGIITNGLILLCLFLRPSMRTQPNFLVCNLTCANFLVSLMYCIWASLNWAYEMEPNLLLCMSIMAPALFSLTVSLCFSVAITHHRSICCISGYRSIHGVGSVSEKWKLISSAISVWTLTFLASTAIFIDIGTDGSLPICIYPVALQNSYLVPFAIFTGCVAGVIIVEHVRVLGLLLYALFRKPTSEKPSPIIIRSTFISLILFIICWAPLFYVSYLFLHPGAEVYQEPYYFQAQWLSILPMLHSALIHPFSYALCERQYLEVISQGLLGLCPFSMRWKIRLKIRRFDMFYRTKRQEPVRTGAESGNDERNYTQVVEMQSIVLNVISSARKDANGRVNFGYYSEYI